MKISVVIPVFNEEESINELYNQLLKALSFCKNYEIIFFIIYLVFWIYFVENLDFPCRGIDVCFGVLVEMNVGKSPFSGK